MEKVTLTHNQKKTFTDTEGGSDLKIINTTDVAGSFTCAIDTGPAKSHTIAAHGSWYTEVPDGQSATIQNTGSVSLNVNFGSSVS